jgi:hypothetical protein
VNKEIVHIDLGMTALRKSFFPLLIALALGLGAAVFARNWMQERGVANTARRWIMDASSARYSVGYVCMIDGKLADAEKLFAASIKVSNSYNPVAQAALQRVRAEMARK